MRKKITALLLMTLCVFQLNAQTRFGVKGGVSSDHYYYPEIDVEVYLKDATRWQLGFLWQRRLDERFSIQPELLYVWQQSDGIIQEGPKARKAHDIHHLELPINLQWGPDLKTIRPFVMGGTYFDFALHFHDDIMKSHINRFDWGLGLGAGIDFNRLQFTARYCWGLKNLSPANEVAMKRNSFNMSIGVLF